MAFRHISLLWSTNGVIMGHMGHTAFLFRQKTFITRSRGWYSLFARAKKPNHHIRSTQVLSLTPHTIWKRQLCQKEKCMINRLWYGNFYTIPHINPRHPYQLEGLWPSGWYGGLGLTWGMIWKLSYNNLFFKGTIFLKNRHFAIQERFNKLMNDHKMRHLTACKISVLELDKKWNDFSCIFELMLLTLIQWYDKKIISFLIQFKNKRLTEILQAERGHIL